MKSRRPRRLYDPSAAKPETEWLKFDDAVKQIAKALALPHEVAEALMCGLCATGALRAASDKHIIDPDEEPMGDVAKLRRVSEADLGEWLRDHCHVAIPRDGEIKRMLRAGHVPGKTITWKEFCDRLRDRCGGWLKKGQPKRGFTDRHIRRRIDHFREEDI